MTANRRNPRTRAPAASQRRGVLWLAIFALVAQLFLTTTHIHIDEEGWVDFPLAQISPSGPAADLRANHYGSIPDESPADAPAGHHDTKRLDCQICQNVPVVSAFLAMAPVAVPPPSQQLTVGPIANSDAVAITDAFSRHQPRAPPARA